MKTITRIIFIYFLLFNSTFFAFPTYAQEATSEAELTLTEIHEPIENPIATDEASVENTSEAAESYIDTGNAEAEIIAETDINRNIVGDNNCFIFLNLYQNPESTVDLTTMMPTSCENPSESTSEATLEITDENIANIEQNINASANTGDNSINSGSSIKTGDATAAAYISTVANTNVVGSNTLFGVVNVYQQTDKDIILPYELSFLQSGNTNALPVYSLMNNNTAIIENNIYAEANTGENTGSEISTGNSVVLIRMADTINTNIFQSGFFVLHINALAPWNGKLLNFDGQTSREGDTLTASKNIPLQNDNETENTSAIENMNETTVENNIQLKANTGGNTGVNSSIATGNATVKAFISTIANTTIVGNNWYHMIVNIFDKFDGNIVLPRPDVVTGTFSTAIGSNEVEITVKYGNAGTYTARDVQIISQLPEGATLLNYSEGGQIDGPRVYWNIGTLEKNQVGQRTFRITLSKTGVYTIATRISTSTDEPNIQNNGSRTVITYEVPSVYVPSATPTPHYVVQPIYPRKNIPVISAQTTYALSKINHTAKRNELMSTAGQVLGTDTLQKRPLSNILRLADVPFIVLNFFTLLIGISRVFGR